MPQQLKGAPEGYNLTIVLWMSFDMGIKCDKDMDAVLNVFIDFCECDNNNL